MKIVLATPLYPPDIAPPAPYVKELARRLAARHDVTILAYAHLPEEVPDVRIIAVDKRRPLMLRLASFALELYRAAKDADVVYAENGASVELPAALVARLTGVPLILHESDEAARQHAASHALYGMIERFARRSAREAFADAPLPKPEIMPFEPHPIDAIADYERSWDAHLARIDVLLRTVTSRDASVKYDHA